MRGKICSSVQVGGAKAGACHGGFNISLSSAQYIHRKTCIQIGDVRCVKTFECLWLHTLHAKPRENEFESFSGQCLSEYIRQLILCPHEIQLNHSLFHLFSDEMMSDVDVFRPGVLDVVAAESYGTLVVTIQRDVIVCKAIIR
ncbi:hypothetical protein Tco_0519305 [Tanacetum coccineum]